MGSKEWKRWLRSMNEGQTTAVSQRGAKGRVGEVGGRGRGKRWRRSSESRAAQETRAGTLENTRKHDTMGTGCRSAGRKSVQPHIISPFKLARRLAPGTLAA